MIAEHTPVDIGRLRELASAAKAANEGPARRRSGGYLPNSADSAFRDGLSPDIALAVCDEVERLRTWVSATVLMVELNALDADGIESIRRTGKELLDG